MIKTYTKIEASDHLKLDVLLLEPEGRIKGILQIHHGMSEYKERYLPFMEFMAEAGYAVVIHDCRGHGKSVRSMEDLGYLYGKRADSLVEDLETVTRLAKNRWPSIPVCLLGHSMGSLVVRAYLKKYEQEICGLVICGSPAPVSLEKAGKIIALLERKLRGERHRSKFLETLSFGRYASHFLEDRSRFAWCCSDSGVVRNYEQSPFCGFTFTVDGYLALFSLLEEVYGKKQWQCRNSRLPICFLAGAEDPCAGGSKGVARAMAYMKTWGYGRIKRKVYQGMRHEILNEKEKTQVYRDILAFVKNSCVKST